MQTCIPEYFLKLPTSKTFRKHQDNIFPVNFRLMYFVTATLTTHRQSALDPRPRTLLHLGCAVGHSRPVHCPAEAHGHASGGLPTAQASYLQDCAVRMGLVRSAQQRMRNQSRQCRETGQRRVLDDLLGKCAGAIVSVISH